MVRLSRILSVAMLVVHLAVGCCTSHAYDCEIKLTSWATHRDTALHGQCPECRCDNPHHEPRECQHHQRPVTSRRRPTGGSAGPQSSAYLAVLPNGCFPRRALGLCQQSSATGRLLLPVRLHLANQVLLI